MFIKIKMLYILFRKKIMFLRANLFTGCNNNNNNNNNTTIPSRGSTQQQETQPIETVSQAMLGTIKTGKSRQRMRWSEEINTFIMRQYYTITKMETIKIGYRQELHDRFMKQYLEMEIIEQQIADQRRAIVTKIRLIIIIPG
jgi:hypothetical protein